MRVDRNPANFCDSLELRRGGDTGRGRVEHRMILQSRFTHFKIGVMKTLIWKLLMMLLVDSHIIRATRLFQR